MMFWAVAAIVVVGTLLFVFAPLIRGGGHVDRRASYDVQVYRDQLREVERDVARGVLSAEEAEGSRLEISRKLLAAADAEALEAAGCGAPLRVTRLAGGLTALVALGLTAGLYLDQGAPGYPDQPLVERMARQAEARASRPRQAEVEAAVAEAAPADGPLANEGTDEASAPDEVALVERLQALLADRPDDLQGHRLLVRSLAALGRFAEAHSAQEQVVRILGEDAAATDHLAVAELMIAAAAGYVSPEAEAALARALSQDPADPLARYYSGLTLLQGGRPDLAYRLWAGLLEEGPPDAPWIASIEAEIGAVAAMAGLPPPESGLPSGPQGGPDAQPLRPELPPSDPEVAGSAEEVTALGARLASEGGVPRDWARLIRSLGALGRVGEAAAIWAEAQEVYASEPDALDLLAEAARDARLIN